MLRIGLGRARWFRKALSADGCTADSLSTGAIRPFSASNVCQAEWMPKWLKNRLPSTLGGDAETEALANLTLDSYAAMLKQMRQIGSLAGNVGGTTQISNPMAQGHLRLYEDIIGNMRPEEKADLTKFDLEAKKRVAAGAKCSVAQVDDCINKFHWMKSMSTQAANLKKQGVDLPKTPEEAVKKFGSLSDFQRQQPGYKPQAGKAKQKRRRPQQV